MKKTLLAAVAVIGFALGASAHAELVTNGGFETGDFTGYTVASSFAGVDTGVANSGSFSAYGGQIGSQGHISQSISTVAGSAYDFSFAYFSGGGTPNSFTASFDGTPVFSIVDDIAHAFQTYTFTGLIASSANTVIDFGIRNDPSYQRLDDVSVNASAAAVPEPETLALLGLGLLGFAASRRKSAK